MQIPKDKKVLICSKSPDHYLQLLQKYPEQEFPNVRVALPLLKIIGKIGK